MAIQRVAVPLRGATDSRPSVLVSGDSFPHGQHAIRVVGRLALGTCPHGYLSGSSSFGPVHLVGDLTASCVVRVASLS